MDCSTNVSVLKGYECNNALNNTTRRLRELSSVDNTDARCNK